MEERSLALHTISLRHDVARNPNWRLPVCHTHIHSFLPSLPYSANKSGRADSKKRAQLPFHSFTSFSRIRDSDHRGERTENQAADLGHRRTREVPRCHSLLLPRGCWSADGKFYDRVRLLQHSSSKYLKCVSYREGKMVRLFPFFRKKFYFFSGSICEFVGLLRRTSLEKACSGYLKRWEMGLGLRHYQKEHVQSLEQLANGR